MTLYEACLTRSSVRSYTRAHLSESERSGIVSLLRESEPGPFGNKPRFELISLSELEQSSLKKLGTYGMIQGAQAYIGAVITPGSYAFEDFGYCFEKIFLQLTQNGFGTCWLGGTFTRSAFGDKLALKEKEIVPCITPVGFAHQTPTLRETIVRFAIGSKKRILPEKLFFNDSIATPYQLTESDTFFKPLNAVRVAPSASNKQPWRILREGQKPIFHFYFAENKAYNSMLRDIKIQNIDMGISLYHFAAVAMELGQSGRITVEQNPPPLADLHYIATWRASS